MARVYRKAPAPMPPPDTNPQLASPPIQENNPIRPTGPRPAIGGHPHHELAHGGMTPEELAKGRGAKLTGSTWGRHGRPGGR